MIDKVKRRAAAFLSAAYLVFFITAVAAVWMPGAAAQASEPIRLVALGDSLTAGYGLGPQDGFVPQLQAALAARGHNVTISNAGVSGDTSSGGLARLDWAVAPDTQAVIVELGANDMLRGIAPKVTRRNLETIVKTLSDRGIPVLLAGMLAAPNLGPAYAAAFDPIYGELAEKYNAVHYPFFLDGVAAERHLNLADGIHPNAAGIAVIVKRITPAVEKLLARVK